MDYEYRIRNIIIDIERMRSSKCDPDMYVKALSPLIQEAIQKGKRRQWEEDNGAIEGLTIYKTPEGPFDFANLIMRDTALSALEEVKPKN